MSIRDSSARLKRGKGSKGSVPGQKIAYAAVDCTKGQNHDLCKQEGVEGYPTFIHFNYGKFAEKYNGDRGEAGFTGFMRSLRSRDQEKMKRREEL
ncbi:unnamed protein product [Arctogadus glacialis]